jgi:hypothetical protein
MKRIAIAIAFATVSTTAFATIQTDVVAANESENFKVECKTNDGTIVDLVVRNGELDCRLRGASREPPGYECLSTVLGISQSPSLATV